MVALGELLVDFTYSGISEFGQRLFEQNPGGAVANALCCAAKAGFKTAFIGKVGRDMHGEFLAQTLRGVGVDTSGLVIADDVFTTLAFVALSPQGERSFSFARKPGADTCLRPDELDTSILEGTRILHVGSLSLTDEPARSATLYALERAKRAGAVITYDPNYRASLWASEAEAAAQMRSVLPLVDMLKFSDEEAALLTGKASPQEAAMALVEDGIRCVTATLGEKGAIVCSREGLRTVPGYAVSAVDTTGAGDAFWGGFLCRFLQGEKAPQELLSLAELEAYARFANATAAICVTRRGGIPALPTLAETKAFMGREGE
ncbi:MAG: carbohydrate kinase [Christensenellaceae bacterium]|nr:carbohydrate kinase [Christensenellaceae bacterium]